MRKNRETCQQYVTRRLSEGWSIVWHKGYHLILSSPDGNILRPVDLRNDVETLRPNAPGDVTGLDFQYPDSGAHWDKVDEVTADDGSTYVCNQNETVYLLDLYNLPAHSGSGTINYIKVYFRCWRTGFACYAKPSLKTGGTIYEGTEITVTTSWTTYSQQWNINPKTGVEWTWPDIDALQIGIYLRGVSGGTPYCTQVYVEVDYTIVAAPTVTTQACTAVEATTATGNGTITATGGENCSRRGFCYKVGTSGDPTTADSVAYDDGSFGTGAYAKGLTGLSPGTSYRVRAYAVNSAGTGYGATVQILTKPAVPTVTTQAVTDIGATTATGHGNITDIGGENASKRGVCWNTTGNPTVADSKSEETGSFGTGAFTRPMTGLTSGQHYYVKAYAYNSAGYGYGSQVEFTTVVYYPSGYIGDVIDCTDLVKAYDRLEWTKEIPGPGQVIEIKIRSSPDLSTWSAWEVIYSSPCTSFATSVQRYLEWVATLTTEQGDTPKLKDLGFFWTKKAE